MDDVFEKSAVTRALEAVRLQPGDDIVVHMLQTELLSLCITQNLKPVIAHCAMQQRKFISERDVAVAAQTESIIPKSGVCSRDRGYLLDSDEFKLLCEKHIDALLHVMRRFDSSVPDIKISREIALVFQELVERCLRGFMEHARQRSHHDVFGYRLCSKLLLDMVGHGTDD